MIGGAPSADLGVGWEALLAAPTLPRRVDLVQCELGWLRDPSLRALRAALDRRLYRALLEDRSSLRIRRLVLYSVPRPAAGTPAAHQALAREHARWVAGLTRDLQNVDGDSRLEAGTCSPYELRQVVVGRTGSLDDLPPDGFGIGSEDAWTAEFERIWTDPARAIEDNRTGDVAVNAPRGDRDPMWHLWRR